MRYTAPYILMNEIVSTKVLKIGKKDTDKDTNKTPLAPSAEGEKRQNVLLFLTTPNNMDIFFFFYSIFFGLPLGVVEVPHGGKTNGARSWQCQHLYITILSTL